MLLTKKQTKKQRKGGGVKRRNMEKGKGERGENKKDRGMEEELWIVCVPLTQFWIRGTPLDSGAAKTH